jgi:multidrug efflux pump subunit AcrA (membrane-fusion protein)
MAFTSQPAVTEAEPITAPAGTASQDAPPQHAAKIHRRKPSPWQKPGFWLALAALAILVVGMVIFRRGQTTGQTTGDLPRTAKVERRDFLRTVRVGGTVEAVETHPVSAPRLAGQTSNSLTITKLLPTGTHVKKGDLLVEFDRQAQIRNAQDREADYNDFIQQINKLQATQAAAKAADDTEIKADEDAVSTKELEVKRSEVKSKIDAEKAKEDLDEANAKIKQARATYQLKRQSDSAALSVLQIQRDGARLAMEHAKSNSEKMAIHSPFDGLVVINSTYKGQQGQADWQEGDDVRAGAPFMQVVNPAGMRVRAQVNQQDMAGIEQAQPVEVRLDAYPELVFHGKVDQISAIGVGGSFSQTVHTFIVIFSIEGADPKLLPDLSAAVDIEFSRKPNVLVVPRDALVSEGGKTYVRVVTADASEMREVKVSAMNDTEAIVGSGVEPGLTVLRGAAPEAALANAAGAAPGKH